MIDIYRTVCPDFILICVVLYVAANIIVNQAAELAAWQAKLDAVAALGDKELPKGKPGNCITRMWARTGWCPLKKDCENWQKVLATIGKNVHDEEGERPQQLRTGR